MAGEGSRKARMSGQPQVLRCLCRQQQLVDGPGLSRCGISLHFRGGKTIKHLVIGWVHGYQLTLQMRRQFRDFNLTLRQHAFEIIAVAGAFSSRSKIEQSGFPAWNLNSFKAELCCPAGDVFQAVERACSPTNWARKIAGPLMVFISF